MKTTHPLRSGSAWDLVRTLRDHLGEPTYLEELAIYLRDDEDFKVTLTRRYMEWVWNDQTGVIPGLYGIPRQRIFMDTGSIKNKLLFIARQKGNKGHISVVPILRFHHRAYGVKFDVRPESSVGESVAISIPNETVSDQDAMDAVSAFIDTCIRRFFEGDLKEKIAEIDPKMEEFVDFRLSERAVLHPRIMDFCKRNGLVQLKEGITYRDVLQAKSNDYSFYERLFIELTGVGLLSRQDHCNVLKGDSTLSVIIPCFNVESTLSHTLSSIANQVLPQGYLDSIEVVLVDDNSTEPIRDFVDSKGYPFRIEIVSLDSNHGVSHARNVGLVHAAGEILLFIDGDVMLSSHYIADHIARNAVIDNAVFVSFKENVAPDDPRVSERALVNGLAVPNYQKDIRVQKLVKAGASGNYVVLQDKEITILEDSNYLKDFTGRVFGVYDLSCMIIGHNFSMRRQTAEAIDPFLSEFKDRGWGMEDVVLGLKALAHGCYVIPVLSAGVYHIDHPPRSGSDETKAAEYTQNIGFVESMLDWQVGRV